MSTAEEFDVFAKKFDAFPLELLDLIQTNDYGENIVACSTIETKNLGNLTTKSGDTLLHFAAKCQNVPVISYLIESGSEIDATNIEGKTPLLCALENRDEDKNVYLSQTAEILCQAGANIHTTDISGNCAAKLVLSDVGFCDDDGLDVIILFLQILNRECDSDYKQLAEKLASIECPLWRAVLSKNCKLIEEMIKGGCPVNSCHPEWKYTALHKAVSFMDLKTTKVLIERGADVDLVQHRGYTPVALYFLRNSSKFQEPEILKMLLNQLVSNQNHEQMVNCVLPMLHGTKESIKIFLEYYNKNVNHIDKYYSSVDFWGRTPLHYLCRNANTGATEEVWNQYFNAVNLRDMWGRTPLQRASTFKYTRLETIKFLLNNGADIHAKCNGHVPPLFYLLLESHLCKKILLQTIKIFLQYGSDIQMIGTYQLHRLLRIPHLVQINNVTEGTVFDIIMSGQKFYMARPILEHLALLEELGNPILEHIRTKINSHQMFKNHYSLCKRKLEVMKRIVIDGNVTLFSILSGSNEQIVKSSRNGDKVIEKLISLNNCSSKYYYYYIIKNRIHDLIDQISIFRKSLIILCKLLRFDENHTEHIIIHEIVKYLNYKDLKNLTQLDHCQED